MNATVNRRMPRCVVRVFRAKPLCRKCRLHELMNMNLVNQTTRLKYKTNAFRLGKTFANRQLLLMSEKRMHVGPYSGIQRHNALHTAQCVLEHSLLTPHVRNFSWHMDEWKFRPRNRTIYLLQPPVPTLGDLRILRNYWLLNYVLLHLISSASSRTVRA